MHNSRKTKLCLAKVKLEFGGIVPGLHNSKDVLSRKMPIQC